MPFDIGKQKLVELIGAGSTVKINVPRNVDLNEKYVLVNRVKEDLFCYGWMVDNNNYTFKIDTGSDVSILKRSLVKEPKRQFEVNGTYIKYPTGEVVPVQFKVIVKVELGKYSLSVPMLVADISDDCILGADFLKMINEEKVFDPILGNKVEVSCSRMVSEVPCSLKALFEENSKHLDSSQKGIFAGFLKEFRDF